MTSHVPEKQAENATGGVRTSRFAVGPLVRTVLGEGSALVLAIVFLAIVGPLVPRLTTSRNLSNLLLNMLPLLAVALGETVVLITGGIDLSVTSIIAACSVVSAWVMSGAGGPGGHDVSPALSAPVAVALGVAAALGTGAGLGLINGISIAILKMPPFLVTLSTTTLISGAAVWATHSQNIAGLPEVFTAIGWGSLLGVPYFVWIVGILAVAVHGLLARSLLGRWLYAIGHNSRVARISGVPIGRVTMAAYLVSGLCAAVASLLYTARIETGSPVLGRELLLDIVGAAVIGGASLSGGKGKVIGTAFGVILFSLIDNTLNLIGMEYYTIMIVKGAVILVAALLDRLRARLLATGA